MAEDKKTLKVYCPKCKAMNILQKEDFRDRAKITFTCAGKECKEQISLDNPDFSPEERL